MMITRRLLAASGLLAVVALTACGSEETASTTTEAPAAETTAKATEHPHWTYEGEEGPEFWGEISEEYVLCADGSAQTPIDVTGAVEADLADPSFAYTAGEATVVNNGHTIQANAAEGNTVTVDGAEFPLKQIHFHAPSEHTIDGQSFAAEVHFVHKTDDGVITVVGVMITEGAENAAWQPYIDGMGVAEEAEQAATIDWAAMLPASHLTFRYSGSLTTPPCTEGVNWLLMESPVELSASQIAAMTAAYEGNSRPVQDLNGREVQLDSSEG
ncbi:MAG: hypothetical protein RJB65_904 [Actinomycetota bacterium]